MSNMNYCRFENTASDLGDCLNALEKGEVISEREKEIGIQMFMDFLNFCEDNNIIEGVDVDAVESLFNKKTEEEDE